MEGTPTQPTSTIGTTSTTSGTSGSGSGSGSAATGTGTGGERPAFVDELVASGRFCRDTALGGIFHRGSISLREISDGDSLHVCIDGDARVSVHVDRFSPVAGGCPDGSCRYSLAAVVAHLFGHIGAQFRRMVRGARGQHRCRLECDLVEVPDGEAAALVEEALASPRGPDCDPRESTGEETAETTGRPAAAG